LRKALARLFIVMYSDCINTGGRMNASTFLEEQSAKAVSPTLIAARRLRAVELLSRNAEHDAHPHTVALANWFKDLPQLWEADIVVLLHALSCAIQRHNMHQEDRQALVHELEGHQLWLDSLMDEARAQADTDRSDE
jgi:hypothetical protein